MTSIAQVHPAQRATQSTQAPSADTAPSAHIEQPAAQLSQAARWIGRIAVGLGAAFLGFDCIGKLLQLAAVVESSAKAGFNPNLIFPLGLIELVCLLPYLFLRTRLLGAVLLTGYLGGAVATHLHMGHPLLSHTLFPLYLGTVLWLGAFASKPQLAQLMLGRETR